MAEREDLARRFEAERPRLRAMAYRMLGSIGEAEEAVQDSWLRLSRADADQIENLEGWLTTVVSRRCLDLLRNRQSRREEPLGAWVPEPIVSRADQVDPEHEVLLADSVGLALMAVLEALGPAERLAFVLHDMFDVPFDQIAPMLERTPTATRQLASRARRRVRDTAPKPDVDPERQRQVVDAFFAAAREGDFEALVAVLDPDVLLRSDGGEMRARVTTLIRGANQVAERAFTFRRLSPHVRPILVNGAAGVLVAPRGRPFSIMAFTVSGGRVVEIDALSDPERLEALDLSALD